MLALLSIATTSVMVGLSTAFSCTHNNALLMHLIIISNAWWHSTISDASTSWSHLPSLHSCHAYREVLQYSFPKIARISKLQIPDPNQIPVLEVGYQLDFVLELSVTLSWMWSKSLNCYIQPIRKQTLSKKGLYMLDHAYIILLVSSCTRSKLSCMAHKNSLNLEWCMSFSFFLYM